MPTMPGSLRSPGAASREEQRRDSDAARRIRAPWRSWYSLAVWRTIREGQLAAEPLCARCAKRGETVRATIVNHVEPHRGDWALFVGGPFESVCKQCHDGEIQREERAAAREAGGGEKFRPLAR